MSAVALADRLCPALGVVLSNALYCAPLPETLRRVKKGTLGELNPLPTSLMVIGTTSWLSYSLSARNPWIAATNVPGAIVAIATFVAVLPLIRPGPQLQQVQGTIIAGASATISLWTYLIFASVSAAARSRALGIYASIICIILFASPLSTIAKVIRTRNAASILAPLTAAQCLNCLMWSTCAPSRHATAFVKPLPVGLTAAPACRARRWGLRGTGCFRMGTERNWAAARPRTACAQAALSLGR
jgi:solute carrier family 50 (sugar transporter)